MTPGAGQRHPEERLGGRLRQLDRVLVQHEVVRGAVFQRAAPGGDDLPREAVPRLVLRDALPDPVRERPHRPG